MNAGQFCQVNCRRSNGLFPGGSIPFFSLKQNGIINTAVHCHISTDKMFLFFNTTKPMDLNSKLVLIFCTYIINVWTVLSVRIWISKNHLKYKSYTESMVWIIKEVTKDLFYNISYTCNAAQSLSFPVWDRIFVLLKYNSSKSPFTGNF